jgi:superfamily I DNA/RNA helicase
VEARTLMSALGPNWTNNFPMKRMIGLIPISAVLKAVPKPDQWAGLLEPRYPQIHYADFLRRNQGWQAITKPRLEVMTIHQAKGREAESVFLDTCLARKTYLGMERNPDDEHRVQYVGVTRAKEIIFSRSRRTFDVPDL